MKLLKGYFILIATLLYLSVSGQDITKSEVSYIPPSPNPASLVKDVNIPINLYTGVPQISIPLFDVKSKNLTIPISLNYNASGIKVQEIASWTGLGWTFNAGGMVTRIVRGLPDEDPNGFSGSNRIGDKIYNEITADYLSNLINGTWDSEPDVFYFQIPGKTGRFILDNNGNPVLYPFQNIKINRLTDDNNVYYWQIIDKDGTVYTLGGDDSSRESTKSKIAYQPDSKYKTYISTWYLASISSPLTQENITLNYNTGSDIDYRNYIKTKKNMLTCFDGWGNYCETTPAETVTDADNIVKIISPKYLSQISSATSIITLNSISSRDDLINGKYLNDIRIKNQSGGEIKKFTFQYSYFVGSNYANTSTAKRLKLDKLVESSNGINLPPYEFYYNTTQNLPPRNSFEMDNWGYYNKINTTDGIPAVSADYTYIYFDKDGWHTQTYPLSLTGCSKEPNLDYAKANILEKMILPTGGSKQLIYGLNYFYDGSTNKPSGGLRVEKMITTDDITSSKIIQNYEYFLEGTNNSSGETYSSNIQYHYISQSYLLGATPIGTVISGSNDYFIRSSQSLSQLTDLSGYHIGYSTVTVKATNGKEIYNFTNFSSHPDIVAEQKDYTIWSNGSISSVASTKIPFYPQTSNCWERGVLLELKQFSSIDKLVKDITYTYDFESTPRASIPSIQAYSTFNCQVLISGVPSFTKFNVGKYYTNSKRYFLKSETTRIFDLKDITKSILATKEYTYNGQGEISSTSQVQSDGSTLKIKYTYPSDLSDWSSKTMVLRNMLNIPIEVVTLKNNNVIDAKLTQYTAINCTNTDENGYCLDGLVLPKHSYSLNTLTPISESNYVYATSASPFEGSFDSKLNKNLVYDAYSNNGNILQLHSVGKNGVEGLYTSYIWDYNGQFPVAEVKNAKKDEIFFDSFEDGKDKWWSPDWSSISLFKGSEVHSGNNILRLNFDKYNWVSKTLGTGIKPNAKYTITGWAKINQQSSVAYCGFEDSNNGWSNSGYNAIQSDASSAKAGNKYFSFVEEAPGLAYAIFSPKLPLGYYKLTYWKKSSNNSQDWSFFEENVKNTSGYITISYDAFIDVDEINIYSLSAAYWGFEENTGGWTNTGYNAIQTNASVAKAGSKYFSFVEEAPGYEYQITSPQLKPGNYKLTYWIRGGNNWILHEENVNTTTGYISISINGYADVDEIAIYPISSVGSAYQKVEVSYGNPASIAYYSSILDNTIEDWQMFSINFTTPSNVNDFTLYLHNCPAGGSNFVQVMYDDIRICPADAQMKTYTYKPLVGVTSVTDERNRTTYYNYDPFGRLEKVFDDKGKILKQHKYNYAP